MPRDTPENTVETDASPCLIGIDWGTTALRVSQIDKNGNILSTRQSKKGLMSVPAGQFAHTLDEEAGDWLVPGMPAVASGMVSSKQGWQEVAYLDCPANLDLLAKSLRSVHTSAGVRVHLVPGVMCEREDGLPDVMRGEECQLAGCASAAKQVCVLPGTHSKWALLDGNTIETFATIMTGEMYALLCEHSILGKMMTSGDHHSDAFVSGVERARLASGNILDQLFGARTLALDGQLEEADTASWLSGLLIGGEIADRALRDDRIGNALRSSNVVLVIGSGSLAERYAQALGAFGIKTRRVGDNAAAAGQLRIAQAANLL